MSGPSVNGSNGRGSDGRFIAGNPGGPGNPHVRQTAAIRAALIEAVKPETVARIIAALIEAAEKGDVVAAREVLDRTIGKPSQTDVLQRLEALEAAVAAKGRL